jgi:hypothetical protein
VTKQSLKQMDWSVGLVAGVVAGALAILGLTGRVADAWAQGGSHLTVLRELEHDTSPPLDKIPPLPPQAAATQVIPLRLTHGLFARPELQTDTVVQLSASTSVSANAGENILGLGNGFTGPNGSFTVKYIPPDTNAAVGETQIVQWVNASFAVFDKTTGIPTYGPAAGNSLWSGFGGPCQRNNSGDPVAQYDKLAKRWVLMQPVFRSPYYICVAVSTTSDATGSYYRYAFPVPNNLFPDYPKLGVWSDGYYVTYNQFQGNSFQGAAACALDRANMLAGNPATMQCGAVNPSYGSLLPADLDGPNPPPDGSPGYFLNFDGNLKSLDLWQLSVDWSNANDSTLSDPTNIQVAAFNEACGGGTCIPQADTSQQLDSLGDRLMYRLAYRNFVDHESMVVSHSVDTSLGYTGVRWYELQSDGTGFGLYQQGTYAPDPDYRWMPSIAMDGAGDIALGYSVSSGSMNPTIRYTGRLPGDVLGTMEGETDVLDAMGITPGYQSSYSRWGDYSSMAIDPVDDCTFWYTTEYQPADGVAWSTRIASFSFPGCLEIATADFSLTASPGSLTLTQGQTGTSTVTVTPSNGFNGTVGLGLSGCPSPTTTNPTPCAIAPTSVTAGSGSATLTVTTDASTTLGSYDITVTGTSGSLSHTATVTLTINTPVTADFSLSASPGNRTVKAGGSGSYTVSVTPSGGYSGTLDLSVSGLPSSATAEFSPTSLTGGSGSSTLTVTTANNTPKGSYTLTITGTDRTDSSLSHSTTVGLKIR